MVDRTPPDGAPCINGAGVDAIISELWNCFYDNTADLKTADKVNLLGLLASCYEQRLEMSANGELVGEAMRQMETVKHQLMEIRPDQAALIESSIVERQSGIVTKQGEQNQEQVLSEQQQKKLEQQKQEAGGGGSDDEALDGNQSSFELPDIQQEKNGEQFSLPDGSSFESGNGHGQAKAQRPTRNKVF